MESRIQTRKRIPGDVDPKDYHKFTILQGLKWLVTVILINDSLVMMDTDYDVFQNAMETYTRPLNYNDDLEMILRINHN